MEFIKPSEISGRILTLLEESNNRVIIVSPYMKISKWYKMTKKLNALKSKGIIPEIYVRDDPDNTVTFNDLDQVGLPYKRIPHLHCKLYLNERSGIVTSMNLLLSSEINSLEIGYITENWEEYNDLLDYFEKYIHYAKPVYSDTIASQPKIEPNEFVQSFKEEISKKPLNAWPWLAKDVLHISTGKNNYSVSINNGYLRITASLGSTSRIRDKSSRQPTLIAKKIADLGAMKIELHPDDVTDNIKLSGQTYRKLKSTSVSEVLKSEIPYMVESVVRFMDTSENQQNQF